jgi:two-component system KDP operon response regulator KdpE
MTSRILVIDDEPQIRKFMRISLAANGYQVLEAENAATGIAQARSGQPDLLILDLGLPDLDGQEVISVVRQFSDTPILVLSVRADETDKVEALDRGANDYVVKPFGVAELMARVRAMLRLRPSKEEANAIERGCLRVDFGRRLVVKDGTEVRLSRKEWDLLGTLAQHADHVVTHKQILKEVWGPAHTEDTSYLRVYVNQLRQKLENDPSEPSLIITEPGVGYRLKRNDQP